MLVDLLNFDPLLLASVTGSMILFAVCYVGYQSFVDKRARSEVRNRLDIKNKKYSSGADDQKRGKKVAAKMAQKTNEFYSTTDPNNLRKLQMQLIRAGYVDPGAVGYFLTARVVCGLLGVTIGLALVFFYFTEMPMANRLIVALLFTVIGYFGPNFYLSQRFTKLQQINRQGFPDVMDLMVVAAEAGLTTEASIERIAKEIETTYPSLSQQLNIAALEIRAGRPMDQALKSFGERLGMEEIQGFATMIQQSKELGTSVSDALRVYSDEMRHKRMMKAEEKAYALPVKLSIPVTLFILPIVVGVAVIPAAVRLMYQ